MAEFYKEGVSTWNKLQVACDRDDWVLAYQACVALQSELNWITSENALDKLDVLGSYDVLNLELYKNNALNCKKVLEQLFVDKGFDLKMYNNLDEFKKEQ